MKYKDLDNYLREHNFFPTLGAGSHIKYIAEGVKLHVLIKRQHPHHMVGKGLMARVRRIVEGKSHETN